MHGIRPWKGGREHMPTGEFADFLAIIIVLFMIVMATYMAVTREAINSLQASIRDLQEAIGLEEDSDGTA